MNRAIRLHVDDNVMIAREDLPAGTRLETENVIIESDVPFGHKIATMAIEPGTSVIKLGELIGSARQMILPGAHVHTHNLAMQSITHEHHFCNRARPVKRVDDTEQLGFSGFHRADGRVGTRNYIGVLSSVNCSASVVRFVCNEVEKQGLLDNYPAIDGIVPCVHTTGCGMADRGAGFEILQRTLTGYARHPNFAGILMIGLGCEVNQLPGLLEVSGMAENQTFSVMTIQQSGGTRKTVEEAIERIKAMLPAAGACERTWAPASGLTLALQCGGSDGYSVITANPALGVASDLLVAQGGTVILSETPEIYGAEHLLTARARSQDVAESLLARLAWWESYVDRHGGELNNNPSPGNKAGGLTTILEKSLGATAKGGSTPLNGVYGYAEPITGSGLVFMDSPGYDPCAATGQVASGANLICFTTGRGSAFGCKPAPSLKVASNSRMFAHMQDDMDINAGTIADGVETVDQVGERIFQALLESASGRQTKSELLNMGGEEFIPWQIGAVL